MFDIYTFLQEHVEIAKGPTRKGEVFLQSCLWCGSPSTHDTSFSVSVRKPVFYCFRCGQKGNWTHLVKKILGITWEQAAAKVNDGLDLQIRKVEKKQVTTIELPPRALFTREAEEYLKSRNLSKQTIEKFDLYFCARGRYASRIIIPVYVNDKPVMFQARTVKKDTQPRYKSPGGAPSVWLNLNSYRPGKSVVVVEGPFDVMRLDTLGIFAICPMGKNISESQIKDLTNLSIHDIILMQDRDALEFQGDTRPLQYLVQSLNKTFDVKISPLTCAKDPGELDKAGAIQTLQKTHTTVADLDWDRVLRWRSERMC